MRFDLIITILGLILLAAMILTLLYGKEYSRHGYGMTDLQSSWDVTCIDSPKHALTNCSNRPFYGPPCKMG